MTATLKTIKGALKVALLPSQALSPIRTHSGLQSSAQPAAHCAQGLSLQRLMVCPLRMLLTFVKHLSQGTNSPRYAVYIHSTSIPSSFCEGVGGNDP